MEIYLVYGITDCPACLRAQAYLMERDLEYVFINTDFSKNYRTAICEEFGWSTFPIIIKVTAEEEVLIGGFSELKFELESADPAPT